MAFNIYLNKEAYGKSKADKLDETIKVEKKVANCSRNKRVLDRFNVFHRKLKVVRNDGFFIAEDISSGGISGKVSERVYNDIHLGDFFGARIVYKNTSCDVSLKVSWKKDCKIGFQFYSDKEKVADFLKKILIPVEIGHSMTEMNAEFLKSNALSSWFHGIHDSNLIIDVLEDSSLSSWRFYDLESFVSWSKDEGFQTGVRVDIVGLLDVGFEGWSFDDISKNICFDREVDPIKIQFIYDVLSSFSSDRHAKNLLNTIEEKYGFQDFR